MTDPHPTHDQLMQCRDSIKSTLVEVLDRRNGDYDYSAWLKSLFSEVAQSANSWAEAHGFPTRITADEAQRIEYTALGHYDYASKFALYLAEVVTGLSPKPTLPRTEDED
jgi:hypothetical protein